MPCYGYKKGRRGITYMKKKSRKPRKKKNMFSRLVARAKRAL